jgi:hypothetical protein
VILAAASVPNPPVLLPGMTGRPGAEVEQLRSACLAAFGDVLATEPDEVLLVGGVQRQDWAQPLSLLVGGSLLADAGCSTPVIELGVPADASPAECVQIGGELADRPGRFALVVMADGSARRGPKAPGYLDARAASFDAALTVALEASDWSSVRAVDPMLAAELLAAGRASWQVLAGALAVADYRSRTHYAADPFGVWYPVLSYRTVTADTTMQTA